MNRIIGIDLGTSTSEVAVLVNDKPFVIPDERGETIIPSVVGISSDNNMIVGRNALEQILLKPEDTVIEVKRLMGSNQRVYMGGKTYTPQQISAYILKYLKESAEKYFDESIEHAVITVPAYFTDEQRRATMDAGKLAGLTVDRIINEPTAAALAYGIEHMHENQHVLVYDLGGGTLDVTVLEMFEGVLEVKASSGNNTLGGKDFDEKLMQYLMDRFESIYDINLTDDKRAMARLKDAVEQCKKALSSQEEYPVLLPFIAQKDGNPVSLQEDVSRDVFDGLIHDLVYSTIEPIKIALKDAKLSKEDIDVVLMVGGSTRIPLVKRFLKEVLDKEPAQLVDPDLAVVMGAAIQAGILNEELSPEKDILITDVCPYTLGIETMGYMNGFFVPDVYDVIIPRNITIPVSRKKVYATVSDNQEKVEINVYQGDSKKASLNSFLGNFILDGVPSARAGNEKVKVGFAYDANGILQVEAIIVSTDKSAGITIETAGVADEVELELDLEGWEKVEGAKQYRGIIRRAEKILEENLNDVLYQELKISMEDLKRAILQQMDVEQLEAFEETLMDLLYDMEEED